MPLVTFSANTKIVSDDVDANFALCVLTDTAKTIAVTHTWSAAQLFAAGVAGAPGVAVGELTSGLYLIGANNLGLALNSAKVVDFATTGVSITGTLATSGTINSQTISASANLTGTLNVVGNVTVATNKFTVAAASGNTVVAGTLNVTGATVLGTLAADLLFTDATYDIGKPGATRPRHLALSGDATIGGNLGLTGSVTTSITISKASPQMTVADTGTAAARTNWTSNGAAEVVLAGIERAAGGGLFVGSSAYAAVFGSVSARDTQIASNNNVRITIDSSGDTKWHKALVALGGGSAPTLGTIGGSGPATAGQNSWLRFLDSSGAAFWVPAWK